MNEYEAGNALSGASHNPLSDAATSLCARAERAEIDQFFDWPR